MTRYPQYQERLVFNPYFWTAQQLPPALAPTQYFPSFTEQMVSWYKATHKPNRKRSRRGASFRVR